MLIDKDKRILLDLIEAYSVGDILNAMESICIQLSKSDHLQAPEQRAYYVAAFQLSHCAKGVTV